MAKLGFLPRILLFLLVVNTCAAFFISQRKLTSTNQTTNLQVPPTASLVNTSDSNPTDAAVKPKEENNKQSPLPDENNSNNGTKTLAGDTNGGGKKDDGSVKSTDLKKPADKNNGTDVAGKKDDDNHVKSSDLNKPAEKRNGTDVAGKKDDDQVKSSGSNPHPDNKNGNKVDEGKQTEANATSKSSKSNNGSCEGSLISCRDGKMVACIEASKDGSKELFLLVLNGGENTLKVHVNVPETSGSPLLVFEVPKQETKRMHIESNKLGKSTDLIVSAENAKCKLPLVHPVSVDYVIKQLSFYSRQVTPIYGAYTLFVLVILFGGTWACCKFRKRRKQDGIPYQELEMGLPESASAVNVDATDGWDHDWDDDWDEENSVRSPGGQQVRNISADGLTSRSPKLDGWENDWDD